MTVIHREVVHLTSNEVLDELARQNKKSESIIYNFFVFVFNYENFKLCFQLLKSMSSLPPPPHD